MGGSRQGHILIGGNGGFSGNQNSMEGEDENFEIVSCSCFKAIEITWRG